MLFCAKLFPSVYKVDLLTDIGKIKRILGGCVSSANNNCGLALIKASVANRAIGKL